MTCRGWLESSIYGYYSPTAESRLRRFLRAGKRRDFCPLQLQKVACGAFCARAKGATFAR